MEVFLESSTGSIVKKLGSIPSNKEFSKQCLGTSLPLGIINAENREMVIEAMASSKNSTQATIKFNMLQRKRKRLEDIDGIILTTIQVEEFAKTLTNPLVAISKEEVEEEIIEILSAYQPIAPKGNSTVIEDVDSLLSEFGI